MTRSRQFNLCRSRLKRIAIGQSMVVMGLLGGVSRASAQADSEIATAALRCFEESRRVGLTSKCPEGVASAETVVRNREMFSPVVYDAVVHGLEEIVVVSDNGRAKSAAVVLLGSLGDKRRSQQLDGVVDQLSRLFRATDSKAARSAVVTSMMWQREEAAAIAFLTSVATEQGAVDRHEHWPAAYQALGALSRMGSAGRGALQSLHTSKSVKNPRARGYLDQLAERGFEPKTR